MYAICCYNKQKKTMYNCIIKEEDDVSALQSAIVNKQLPINTQIDILNYTDLFNCKLEFAKKGYAVATCEITHGQTLYCVYDIFTDVFKFIDVSNNICKITKEDFAGFLDFQGRLDIITMCLTQSNDIKYLTQVLGQIYVKIDVLNSKSVFRPSVDKYQRVKYNVSETTDLSLDNKSKYITVACSDTIQNCILQTDITIKNKDDNYVFNSEDLSNIDENDYISNIEISIINNKGKVTVIELQSLNYVILNIKPYCSKSYYLFIYPFLMSYFKKNIYTPTILMSNINILINKYK